VDEAAHLTEALSCRFGPVLGLWTVGGAALACPVCRERVFLEVKEPVYLWEVGATKALAWDDVDWWCPNWESASVGSHDYNSHENWWDRDGRLVDGRRRERVAAYISRWFDVGPCPVRTLHGVEIYPGLVHNEAARVICHNYIFPSLMPEYRPPWEFGGVMRNTRMWKEAR
jgi:hypothetical protein